MANKVKIAFYQHTIWLILVWVFSCFSVFAQKPDSIKVDLRPKAKTTNKNIPIKGSVPSYKPNTKGYLPSQQVAPKDKPSKTLTILKIYPNPVTEQLNISLRLEKATNLSIKITDLLGNEVVTLINEKTAQGEQVKTFSIPSKINSGIYFLKIIAGGESTIKRISVL